MHYIKSAPAKIFITLALLALFALVPLPGALALFAWLGFLLFW